MSSNLKLGGDWVKIQKIRLEKKERRKFAEEGNIVNLHICKIVLNIIEKFIKSKTKTRIE